MWLVVAAPFLGCTQETSSWTAFTDWLVQGYDSLHVPTHHYDFHENFGEIPDKIALQKQQAFFTASRQRLAAFQRHQLSKEEQQAYDQVLWEVGLGEERVGLELQWDQTGRQSPAESLHDLPNFGQWYAFYVKRIAGVDMSADEVFVYGQEEVKRVQREIDKIRERLGFRNASDFQQYLQRDTFFITNKADILARYETIQATIRKHLDAMFYPADIPPLDGMEWPNAGPYTPPGMYLAAENSPYGKSVFQFNFYNGRHNWRAMDWLFIHEGIPGHHYHFSVRSAASTPPFTQFFYYPGHFEGWAAYVENLGKDLGLYTNAYTELGKWEWDLARSARLVVSVGIHCKGWTHQQALDYWRQHVPGQEDIAEREVTRCTNWPTQVLSYKLGEKIIKETRRLLEKKQGKNFDIKAFHAAWTGTTAMPPQVIAGWLAAE